MLHLTFCLHRLPALSHEAFLSYWFDTHAPLVRSVREVLRIKSYTQFHGTNMPPFSAALQASRGAPEPYDGIAHLVFEADDLEYLTTDDAARQAGALLLEDEQKFIDLPRSPLWYNAAQQIF